MERDRQPVQLSIGKLASVLAALLISVTLVTTAASLFLVHKNFRSLEERHAAEAHDTVRNAAIAISNQIRFYQHTLDSVTQNPEVADLLEFAEESDIADWSQTIGRLLPNTLGSALASRSGVVFGDPLMLRVGEACQRDMQHFADGSTLHYPLMHTDVPGLEHFDLLARIRGAGDQQTGYLLVSFRLSMLHDLLQRMASSGDVLRLLTDDGQTALAVGANPVEASVANHAIDVPDTPWRLVLQRPRADSTGFFNDLLLADAVIVVLVIIAMLGVVRATHVRFVGDMARVHRALEDVLADRYRPSDRPTGIKEVGVLLAATEQLAAKIQDQRNTLRHQSLSDPLTGVYNRRYFDLMLAHLHEQSRRQAPATLVLIDLNDFKHINDEFGHAAGDRILQHAADYLRQRVRGTDIVTRLGGDEFALILNHMAADRLDEWLTTLVHDYDHRVLESDRDRVEFCQFSIGAASIDAQVYAKPHDVLSAADAAMYSVKGRRHVRHSRFAVARVPAVTPLNPRRDAQ